VKKRLEGKGTSKRPLQCGAKNFFSSPTNRGGGELLKKEGSKQGPPMRLEEPHIQRGGTRGVEKGGKKGG